MIRSIEMQTKTYPSLGRCIFCGCTQDLTAEHIVPEALTGVGEMKIANGSCRTCNNYANEAYEQIAIRNDFLAIKNMLGLRRKRRGKKQRPRRVPRISYSNEQGADLGELTFDQEIPPENYPPFYHFVIHPPAGLLVGIDRSGGGLLGEGLNLSGPDAKFEIGRLDLDLPNRITPFGAAIMETLSICETAKTIAKMAYCWAVAENGLEAFDTKDLVDLLMGRRNDVFNFVGFPLVPEQLAMLRLHKFYFRKRGETVTVLVHTFASFGGPAYEIVVGKEKTA